MLPKTVTGGFSASPAPSSAQRPIPQNPRGGTRRNMDDIVEQPAVAPKPLERRADADKIGALASEARRKVPGEKIAAVCAPWRAVSDDVARGHRTETTIVESSDMRSSRPESLPFARIAAANRAVVRGRRDSCIGRDRGGRGVSAARGERGNE